MAYVVDLVKSQDDLAALVGGTVHTLNSEQELEDFLNTLTTEVITSIMAGGNYYVVVLDADVSPATLLGNGAKGGYFVSIKENP